MERVLLKDGFASRAAVNGQVAPYLQSLDPHVFASTMRASAQLFADTTDEPALALGRLIWRRAVFQHWSYIMPARPTMACTWSRSPRSGTGVAGERAAGCVDQFARVVRGHLAFFEKHA